MQNSPFQSGATVKDIYTLQQNELLTVRIESGGTFLVVFKVNGVPSSTTADGFLTSGDSIELTGPGTVSVLSITGDPKIYFVVRTKQ